MYAHHSWRPAPDFNDPKLIHIRVELRLEYKSIWEPALRLVVARL
jgi:hypothetical protein